MPHRIAATLEPAAAEVRPAADRPAPARRMWESGACAVLDQAIVSGTSFATSLILGRYGTVAQLGVYFLLLRVIYLAREVQARIVSAPYAVFCHGHSSGSLPTYSGNTLFHQLCGSAAVASILLACGLVLSLNEGTSGYGSVILIASLTAPAIMLHDFVRQFAFAHQQMRRAALVDGSIAAVQLSGLAVLMTTDSIDATSVLAMTGAACALGCAGWFATRTQVLRLSWASVYSDWIRNWSFAKWALVSKLIGECTPYVIPCLLTWSRGVESTGVFAACATTVGFANVFVGGLGRFLCAGAPRVFADEGLGGLRRLMTRAAALFATTIGALAVVMFLLGDSILVALFGEAFSGQAPVLGILTLGILANSVSVVIGNGIWAVRRPRANLGADVTTTLTSLLLATSLIGPLGIVGAAAASTAGIAAGSLVRYRVWIRLDRELTGMANSPERERDHGVA